MFIFDEIEIPTKFHFDFKIEIPIAFNNFDQKFRRNSKLILVEMETLHETRWELGAWRRYRYRTGTVLMNLQVSY
jgi:hypothetical protein